MAKKKGREPALTWQPVIYETKDGQRPAIDYLTPDEFPDTVRKELLTTVAAVLQVGPPRFPTSTNRWRLMHKSKGGGPDMSGICEARDKQAKLLYRLFCLIDRQAPEHGLAAPSLVLLSGITKPDNTVAPIQDYKEVDGYRKDYLATRRIALDDETGAAFWPDFSDDKP
jgi:hypothetical protein